MKSVFIKRIIVVTDHFRRAGFNEKIEVFFIRFAVSLLFPVGIFGMKVDKPESFRADRLHRFVDRSADPHHCGRGFVPYENPDHVFVLRIFGKPFFQPADSRNVAIRNAVVVQENFQPRRGNRFSLFLSAGNTRYEIHAARTNLLKVIDRKIAPVIRYPHADRKPAEFFRHLLIEWIH